MKTSLRPASLVAWIAFASLLLVLPVFAGKSPNPNNGHGKITQVSANSITVQPKNGDAKTYSITSSTVVTLDGQPSSTDALAAGEHAKIKSKDGTTARKITAHTKGYKKATAEAAAE